MYNELLLFRNELKNKLIYKYKLLGILTQLIYSKKIFKKNSEISEFLNDVFGIMFKDYILKSRTNIVANLTKHILSSENKNDSIKKLYTFIENKIEQLKREENIKEIKNEFDGWIR